MSRQRFSKPCEGARLKLRRNIPRVLGLVCACTPAHTETRATRSLDETVSHVCSNNKWTTLHKLRYYGTRLASKFPEIYQKIPPSRVKWNVSFFAFSSLSLFSFLFFHNFDRSPLLATNSVEKLYLFRPFAPVSRAKRRTDRRGRLGMLSGALENSCSTHQIRRNLRDRRRKSDILRRVRGAYPSVRLEPYRSTDVRAKTMYTKSTRAHAYTRTPYDRACLLRATENFNPRFPF